MAAEKVFKNVLNHVANSKLNFSIYQTPFSAQLSLKKSFANHYEKKYSVEETETEIGLQFRIEQLEISLQTSEFEKQNLKKSIEENEKIIENLKTKCKNLEVSIKSGKKKSKKERQKAEQEETFNIKAEETDYDEEIVNPDISTFNKYDLLAKISNRSEKDKILEACGACGTRKFSKITLSVCTSSGFDIIPLEKFDKSAQTHQKEYKIGDTQTKDDEVFPHTCFYCEKGINSKKELQNHSKLCHETLLNVRNQEKYKVADFNMKSSEHSILFPQTLFPPPILPPLLFPQPSFPPPYPFQTSISCYTCGNGEHYSSKIDLKKHYDEAHPELILFWCNVCFTNFARERGLKSHMRNSHKVFT